MGPVNSPTLYLRGNRDYLHSTTLFDAFCSFHKTEHGTIPTDIDYVFNKATNEQVSIIPVSAVTNETVVATFKSSSADNCAISRGEKISDSREYDEDRLAKSFLVEDNSVSISPNLQNSFIDHAVAGFKLIASKHSIGGRLAFARLMLSNVPKHDFAIHYKRLFNRRFHEGIISSPCGTSGKIYFGEWT